MICFYVNCLLAIWLSHVVTLTFWMTNKKVLLYNFLQQKLSYSGWIWNNYISTTFIVQYKVCGFKLLLTWKENIKQIIIKELVCPNRYYYDILYSERKWWRTVHLTVHFYYWMTYLLLLKCKIPFYILFTHFKFSFTQIHPDLFLLHVGWLMSWHHQVAPDAYSMC